MDSSGPWDCRGSGRNTCAVWSLRDCVKVCLQPNDIYLCPTLKQTTKMGELKNVLSEVHLKDECVGEMRSWTLSQVPPQFTFQSKSGYFYSIQPHHKCTFLSSQQWSTLDTVLFIKRSFQRRSTPVPCWPGAHMKKLSYEGDSLNTTQLQHFCDLSDCSACTSFSFISTTVPYLDKGSSCICISQEHNQALLFDTQLKTFSLAPPTLHSKWQLRFISCLQLAMSFRQALKEPLCLLYWTVQVFGHKCVLHPWIIMHIN